MVSFATKGTKGTFPGWMQLVKIQGGVDLWPGTTGVNDMPVSWAGRILNEIDRQADWTSMLKGNLGVDPAGPANDIIPPIEVFGCPSDAQTNDEAATLTYVVNSGGPDDPDNPSDYKANGMSHNLVQGFGGPTVRSGSGDIPDGSDRTILLSENIHKDHPGMPSGGAANNWLRTSALGTGRPDQAEQYFGMVWVYDSGSWANPTTQERINNDPVGGNYTTEGARYARPTSAHPDLFIISYASGATRSIKNDIDYRVYQQLLTPNGAKCVWTLDPSEALPNAFLNAEPTMQLKDSDL
jgi:hypothetical protein